MQSVIKIVIYENQSGEVRIEHWIESASNVRDLFEKLKELSDDTEYVFEKATFERKE